MVLLVAKSPQVIGTVYQASIGVQSEQIRDSGIVYDRVLLRLNVISDKYGNARCESDRLLGIESQIWRSSDQGNRCFVV